MPYKDKLEQKRHDKEYYQTHRRKRLRWQAAYYASNRDTVIQYNNSRAKDGRRRNKEKIWDYLIDHPCVDCGEDDPVVLQFDHVRGVKKYNIGAMGALIWSRVEEEITKCEVRCANCHARKTHKERNYWIPEVI